MRDFSQDTSALALNNVTLPYVQKLANLGWEKALQEDEYFAAGLNVHGGKIRHAMVAEALGFEMVPVRLVA